MNNDMQQIDDAAPTAWQGYLDQFKAMASTPGLVAHVQTLEDFGVTAPSASAMLTYQFGLHTCLARAYLLAAVQCAAGQTEPAFDAIARAARGAHFDRRAPSALSRDWRDYYGDLKAAILKNVQSANEVLGDIARCYVAGNYDVRRDADSLLREACELSLSGQEGAYTHLVAEAGVLLLMGSSMWLGWLNEGSDRFRHCAIALDAAGVALKAAIPLAPIDAQRGRADELAAALADVEAGKPSTDLVPITNEDDWSSEGYVMALAQAAARDRPLTDAEIAAMGEERERLIDCAMGTLMNSANAPGGLAVPVQSIALRALGRLRADEPHIISQIVAYIANAGFESPVVDAGVDALADIGAAAVGPCMAHMRNSLNEDGRLNVAHALGVVGRGDHAAYQVLADWFRAAEYDQSSWALALAATHDPRAVAPIAQAFTDLLAEDIGPNGIEMAVWDYLDALHELGALSAPGDAPSPESEGRAAWRSVEVRGAGTLANAVPPNWAPPDQRPDDDDDDDVDWLRSVTVDEVDDDDVIDRIEDMSLEDIEREFGARFTVPPPLEEFPPPEPPMPPYVAESKVGRNDPCPCGSGKKYKHCHGKVA